MEKSYKCVKIRIFKYSYPLRTPWRVLSISRQCLIFAETKRDFTMKKKESATDRLFRLLETERSLPDLPAACRRLHVLPGALNEALLRESGISAEELILRQQLE